MSCDAKILAFCPTVDHGIGQTGRICMAYSTQWVYMEILSVLQWIMGLDGQVGFAWPKVNR